MRMTRGIPPTPEEIAVPDTDPVYSSIADRTDLPVTVTVQTALGDDPTFAKPNESGDGFVGVADVGGISVTGFVTPAAASATLAAGATTYVRVSGAWAFARIKAVAPAAPAAGGTLDVAWSAKHRGD